MPDISEVGLAFFNTSVYGGVADSYWTVMMEDISAALQRRGDRCFCIHPENPEHFKLLVAMATTGVRARYLLLFNFAPPLSRDGDPGSLGALGGVDYPYLSLFLDHPVLMESRLAEMEGLIAANPALRPLRRYGLMEAEHLPAMERMGIPAESCFIFPQGGGPPAAAPKPIERRSITAVFAGTVAEEIGHQAFCDQIGLAAPNLRRLAEQAVSDMMDGDEDVYVAVNRLFTDTEYATNTRELITLTKKLDYRARTLRRHRLFRSLRGLPVQFWGNAADDFRKANPNVEFKGNIGFRKLLDVMNDAKVMLNDTINLRSSALIRVFYGMARGCIVATERNRFLDEEFISRGAATAIPTDDVGVGERILELASRPAEAQAMVETATPIYAGAHTWDHRVPAILKALNGA